MIRFFHSKIICILGSGQNPVSERCCIHGRLIRNHCDSLEKHPQKYGEQQGGQSLHHRQVCFCAPRVPESVSGKMGTHVSRRIAEMLVPSSAYLPGPGPRLEGEGSASSSRAG